MAENLAGRIDNACSGENVYPDKIESISDILDIVSRPDIYLADILESEGEAEERAHQLSYAPLGRSHQGAPRPFPHGLWFRGVSKVSYDPIPSIFRTKDKEGRDLFINERELFADIRLRVSNIDLRGYSNIELMCLMQHHKLPTRLMDWTESPLVAAFFAASGPCNKIIPLNHMDISNLDKKIDAKENSRFYIEAEEDAAIYVLNAYRLNRYTHLLMQSDSNIFNPQEIDVVFRAIMAEHTYLESVLTKIVDTDYLSKDNVSHQIQKRVTKLREIFESISLPYRDWVDEMVDPAQAAFMRRLSSPVAVIPRRNHARMDAQLSCFTIHGGNNCYPFDDENMNTRHIGWHFMEKPIHLHDINGSSFENSKLPNLWGVSSLQDDKIVWGTSPQPQSSMPPFMKKFQVSRKAVVRIMIELDRLGINESMIYPDIENQSQHATRRWSAVKGDRAIFQLPKLGDPMSSSGKLNEKKRAQATLPSELYGIPAPGDQPTKSTKA